MPEERSIPQDDKLRDDMKAPSEEPTKRADEDTDDEVQAHHRGWHGAPVQDSSE